MQAIDMGESESNHHAEPLLAPGERPTLKTISRITGLAVATVSRALHDAPDIGAKTKKRVNIVAGQIGYTPNRAGVRLRTGKTNVISLVLHTDQDMMSHTAKLISSVAGALRHTAYHLIITPYFPDEDPMDPIRYIVETGSADGVIMNQITPQDPRVEYLMARNFPFATHGRSAWRQQHAYFDFDNTRFGELAIKALARRGRKNVVLIAPPAEQNYAIDLLAGSETAAQAQGIGFSVLGDATSSSPGMEIEFAIARYLRLHPETDAILCASATSAMAAVCQAEGLGHTIGSSMDVFGKEAIPFLTRFRPGILTVQEGVDQAGQFLAKAVIRRISDPQAAPMQDLDVPEFSFAPDDK